MKVKLIAVLAAMVALAVPSIAQANYHYTESGAKAITKDAVSKRYFFSRYKVSASCRPQGASYTNPRFKYHRWVCGWAALADDGITICGGQLRIIGSDSGPGNYYATPMRGMTCGISE